MCWTPPHVDVAREGVAHVVAATDAVGAHVSVADQQLPIVCILGSGAQLVLERLQTLEGGRAPDHRVQTQQPRMR